VPAQPRLPRRLDVLGQVIHKYTCGGRYARSVNARPIKLGRRLHGAHVVREDQAVKMVQRWRELPAIVLRMEDVGIGPQHQRVSPRLEPGNQAGQRLVEPEDVVPGFDEFLVRNQKAAHRHGLVGKLARAQAPTFECDQEFDKPALHEQTGKLRTVESQQRSKAVIDLHVIKEADHVAEIKNQGG